MMALEEMDGTLTLGDLATAEDGTEPYVLSVYPGPEEDGRVEVFVVPVMKREEGVLLALPAGVFPAELLEDASREDADGISGPSIEVDVPAVVMDNGTKSLTGDSMKVLMMDCSTDVLPLLQLPGVMAEVDYGFDRDHPYALPAPDALISKAIAWISNAAQNRMAFYSAEPTQEEEVNTPPVARKKRPGKDTPTAAAKKRRRLQSQSTTLHGDDHASTSSFDYASAALDRQTAQPGDPVFSASSTTSIPARKPFEFSHAYGGKAKPQQTCEGNAISTSYSTSAASWNASCSFGQACSSGRARDGEGEAGHARELEPCAGSSRTEPSTDSACLPNCFSEPRPHERFDEHGSYGWGQGVFYTAVLQAMCRRMAPTSSCDITPQQMLARGISGTRYVERFGGYGRMREWGQLQYQVMTALDFLEDNINAAKDTVALLAVTLEQGVLDQGRL